LPRIDLLSQESPPLIADPTSVTYNAGAVSLPRINSSGRASTYAAADGALTLDISHTVRSGRESSLIKLSHKKTTSDPLFPSQNRPYTMSVHLVMNRPFDQGYSDAEATLVYDALTAWLTNATNKGKIMGGES
jgi:hypothetical protein